MALTGEIGGDGRTELRASIIVPTFGRNRVLIDTLSGIHPQLTSRDEMIVIDQSTGHDAETMVALEELVARSIVSLHVLPAPWLTLARNIGAKMSRGEVLIYVDDDVRVDPDFIEGHLFYYSDPTVGAVAGRCIVGDRILPNHAVGGYVSRVYGANMSFRRSALFGVGGFDTNIVSGWREESECVERVVQAGWRIADGVRCCLVHLEAVEGGDGARRPTDDVYRRYYHNVVYTTCKRPILRAVLGLPRAVVGTFRHRYPGHRRFLTPKFLVSVFLKGCFDGLRTRFRGRRGPFIVESEDVASGVANNQAIGE